MTEYVDRELVREIVFENVFKTSSAEQVNAVIDSIPAADVRPVRRGTWGHRWICSNMSGYEYACSCSACSKPTYRMSLLEKMPNFCPNCGADMREES